MCQKCLDAVTRHFPNIKEEEIWGFLMGATCFPLGTPEQIEDQLMDLKDHTDGTLKQALAYADSMIT